MNPNMNMDTEWQMPELVPVDESDPRIQAAVAELREMIAQRFPTATFEVARRDDPEGIYLIATVDVPDLDEVTDIVISRIVDMQVKEGLPVYVVPDWPPERIRAYLRQQATTPIAAKVPILTP